MISHVGSFQRLPAKSFPWPESQSGIGWVLICPLVYNQIRRTAGKLAAIAGMIGRSGYALLAVHGADHDPVDQAAGGKLGHIQLQLEGDGPDE